MYVHLRFTYLSLNLVAEEITTSTRTGRDPDNIVIVPKDPKPHLWTMTWKGIKWIINKFWERVCMNFFYSASLCVAAYFKS